MQTKLATAALAGALALMPATALAGVDAVPVSGRTVDARPVTLAFDASGRTVASWSGLRGPSADELRPFSATAAAPPGGTWRAGARLPRTVVDHAVAFGRGPVAAVVTMQQEPASHRRSRTLVVLRLWDTRSATFGRRIRLYRGPAVRVSYEGPSPTAFSPRIGMSADGDVVVAWLRTDTRSHRGIWVAELRADGLLRRPRRLAGMRAGYPQLRIAPDGTGLLVWSRDRSIQARHRDADGRWGAVEAVGTAPDWVNGLEDWQIAGAGDRFVLAGVVTRRGAGVRTQVFADQRAAGGAWSGAVLGEYTFNTTGETSFVTDHLRAVPVVAADGRALVAWPDLVDGRMRTALSTLSASPGQPLLLSSPDQDAAVDDAAIRADGTAAVTWFDRSSGDGTPNLAQVDSSGTTTITPALATERALVGSRVAFDPLTGRPTVLWAEGTAEAGYRLVSWTAP